MDNLPIWVSVAIAVVLFLTYVIGLIINAIKLHKLLANFKATLKEAFQSKNNQITEETAMKKILCDKCGKDITSSTAHDYHGLDLCDSCYEKVLVMEKELEGIKKQREQLLKQLDEINSKIENFSVLK